MNSQDEKSSFKDTKQRAAQTVEPQKASKWSFWKSGKNASPKEVEASKKGPQVNEEDPKSIARRAKHDKGQDVTLNESEGKGLEQHERKGRGGDIMTEEMERQEIMKQLQQDHEERGVTKTAKNDVYFDPKADEPIPDIYRHLYDVPGLKPPINIGQKWGNTIQRSVVNQMKYERALRHGGLTGEAIRRGKLGIDLYLILFACCGAFILPAYYYFIHFKGKRKISGNKHDLTREEAEDLEHARFDLDDISKNTSNYNLYTSEIRQEHEKKLRMREEIDKLRGELYPDKEPVD